MSSINQVQSEAWRPLLSLPSRRVSFPGHVAPGHVAPGHISSPHHAVSSPHHVTSGHITSLPATSPVASLPASFPPWWPPWLLLSALLRVCSRLLPRFLLLSGSWGLDVSQDASFFPSSSGSLNVKSRECTKLSLPTWRPRTLITDYQGFSAGCGADSCVNWSQKVLPGILVLSALEQRWGEGTSGFAQNLALITANEAT